MTKQEIIDLIQRRIDACELALHDLYTLASNETIEIDFIRLEEQIEAYRVLLSEIF